MALAVALGSTFRPTQASLLPWLARTPTELTAANVAATVAENSAALVGPVLAGALLVWTDAATTMVGRGGGHGTRGAGARSGSSSPTRPGR